MIEPGSRLFRVRDLQGQCHQLSSYCLKEAGSGDGICFPEDLAGMLHVPQVLELRPWESGGAVRDLEQAVTYMGLLRQRFLPLLRRVECQVVLSPYLLESQRHVWLTLLREASIKRFQLQSNLDRLASVQSGETSGLYLHLGAGGGDLGLCLQGETYRYSRLLVGEDTLVVGLRNWLSGQLGETASWAEALRVFRIVVGEGLAFPSGRLVEVGCGEGAPSSRVSFEQEVLLQSILALARPQFEAVESFVRALDPQEQAELFRGGLQLSGGAASLRLCRDVLTETFEFPVLLHETPALAVLTGSDQWQCH